MKAFISVSLFMFLTLSAFAQNMIATPLGSPEVLYNENGVSLTSQMTTCNNTDRGETTTYKLLTLTNNTAAPATLKVRMDSYYDGKCYTCENDEYTFTFKLEANETKTGSCITTLNPALCVFHSMKDGYIKEVLSDLKLNIVRLN